MTISPLTPTLRGLTAPSSIDAVLDRQRVLRAARKGRAIELGSVARPFSPRSGDWPLESLEDVEGLTLRLVVAPGVVDHRAQRLASLDRRHAVTIEVLCPLATVDRPAVEGALATVRRFARHGLNTVLLLTTKRHGSATPRSLDPLFRQARESGASDVRHATPRWADELLGRLATAGPRRRWGREIALQKLRHGFAQGKRL